MRYQVETHAAGLAATTYAGTMEKAFADGRSFLLAHRIRHIPCEVIGSLEEGFAEIRANSGAWMRVVRGPWK